MNRSTVFPSTLEADTEKRTQKGKNIENRLKDHGKDFLFGKADFNDYKNVLRRTQTVAQLAPKVEYNPKDRQLQDLMGSQIFNDNPSKGVAHLIEKNEISFQEGDFVDNPDNIAKNKKSQNLQSSIFGTKQTQHRQSLQIQPASQLKEVDDKKKKNLISQKFKKETKKITKKPAKQDDKDSII